MAAIVIPTLRSHDAAAAIEWLCSAFGFQRRLVVPGEAGTVAHAQLAFGTGMVMISSARDDDPDQLVSTVKETGQPTAGLYVVVDDVDEHARRARAAGADIREEPHEENHGRLYSCADPDGNIWVFGEYDPWSQDN